MVDVFPLAPVEPTRLSWHELLRTGTPERPLPVVRDFVEAQVAA